MRGLPSRVPRHFEFLGLGNEMVDICRMAGCVDNTMHRPFEVHGFILWQPHLLHRSKTWLESVPNVDILSAASVAVEDARTLCKDLYVETRDMKSHHDC